MKTFLAIMASILNLYLFMINFVYFKDYADMNKPTDNFELSIWVGNISVWFILIIAQIFLASWLLGYMIKINEKW